MSDGQGAYRDRVGGVDSNINLNSGDYRLNTANATRPRRYLRFHLSAVTETTTPSGCSGYPSPNSLPGWLQVQGFLNVNDLLSVPADGAEYETGAMFDTFEATVGRLSLFSIYNPTCGTTPVKVQHFGATSISPETWIVRAAPSSSDLAAQLQYLDRQYQPVRYFRLPFTLTLTRL